ncbi:MAG: VOC family protein [Actinomycetes bacterium]
MATYKKLCVDARSPALVGPFWAGALDLTWQPAEGGEGGLVDAAGRHVVWFNRVAAPSTERQRIRLELWALTADAAEPGRATDGSTGNDALTDPEGGRFRVSAVHEAAADPRRAAPAGRVRRVVVDSHEPVALARWWAGVFGAVVVQDAYGAAVTRVPGLTVPSITFLPGAAGKTAPNRIHWDVSVPDAAALVSSGATLLRPMGGDIAWHVLADPEGNEFCAFPSPPGAAS